MKNDKVRIEIAGHPHYSFDVAGGGSLFQALSAQDISIPSACGGHGYCGLCRVKVLQGGGEINPGEQAHIIGDLVREGMRLSCQVRVEQNIKIELPPEVFRAKKLRCKVRSIRNVATFIKEVVLDLPDNEELEFRAGSYVQLECPPHTVHYRDFDIDEKHRGEWDRRELLHHVSTCTRTVMRTYSLANYPGEQGIIMLNVRIAAPPREALYARPGIASSYIFSLKPGDEVTVLGAFGNFFAADTDAEMCFVAGGAGMAPMRSHIFDQFRRLKTTRKVTFWYGARSLSDAFYVDEFDGLAREHDNFDWTLALSASVREDKWTGETGLIHRVLHDNYLKNHPAPEDIEYYLCGPPAMNSAVTKMLVNLGVEKKNIMFDDFS